MAAVREAVWAKVNFIVSYGDGSLLSTAHDLPDLTLLSARDLAEGLDRTSRKKERKIGGNPDGF